MEARDDGHARYLTRKPRTQGEVQKANARSQHTHINKELTFAFLFAPMKLFASVLLLQAISLISL